MSHTITAKYIEGFFRQASRQGKQAIYVLEIGDFVITGTVERR